MASEYLIILLIVLGITIWLEKTCHLQLFNTKKERVIITLVLFLIGVAWDTFAIYRGHWLFLPEKNLGITIGLMPLEEYLFMLIQPYFIITIYKLVESKLKIKK
ncbi:MAG: hypothetical protein A2406_00560 [Candidatus Komeilibacteria bacterium RIFOXYC1_FULL_37_11]|uniref:Lycopene cyclase domain-containing protein n=1 Tax=Candidatus Komeilibacteria bacterium RIFOXYC1_FULL_37_11 TaxID=1798555 RepID=A0A1G2BXX4_9BACT|nr:MAG: hypothetical protein A2406_00560 [Candidatus Komeilibacteria bacterium RIFOXYC1_FULL_37_11]OGY95980.1 MAG: hypothetical protein A2611_04170 [Candidatus Komeilibacteria bacterium RIFOXYD1_FULL_37_29]OGY97313.1 MAG: hypothetical protein A2543_01600 [Candidatus Komeilibacteria bacterium RIFOXYD2_FULL_37_8]